MTLGVASTVDTSMTHIIEEDLSVERFFSIVNFQGNFPTEFLFNRNNPCLSIFYDSIRIVIIFVYLSFMIQFES